MNINATLFVQALVFIVFVMITVKYIWPLLDNILEKRRKEIADGLAAAEQGKQDLALAHHQSQQIINEAKAKATHIVEQSTLRANCIIDDAKEQAIVEGERLITAAQQEIQQHYNTAKQQLMKQVSHLVIAGAEKVLQREVDSASNDQLINALVNQEIG